MTLHGSKAEVHILKSPWDIFCQTSLSVWIGLGNNGITCKETFQAFLLSRQLHTFIHCSWMCGMYPLVSVQQGTGQSLYLFSKFILRIYHICSAHWSWWWFFCWFFGFFKAARLCRQTIWIYSWKHLKSQHTHLWTWFTSIHHDSYEYILNRDTVCLWKICLVNCGC